jgi:Tfp pilus assembly protein PilO
MSRHSSWRSRAGLLAVLLVLVLVNVVVLVSYAYFYDSRVQSLVETRKELEKKLAETRAAADKVVATETRLASLHQRLEDFFGETLGARRERLAKVIEDVYAITRKLGMRPSTIGYHESPEAGVDRFGFTFRVEGTYADIKKLLYELESSKSFFVLETVGVATDDTQPDVLTVSLEVAHYFRGEESRLPQRKTRTIPLPAKASAREVLKAAGGAR